MLDLVVLIVNSSKSCKNSNLKQILHEDRIKKGHFQLLKNEANINLTSEVNFLYIVKIVVACWNRKQTKAVYHVIFDFSAGYTIGTDSKFIHFSYVYYILILKVKNMVHVTFIFVLPVSTKIPFFKTELVFMWGRRKVKSSALALLTYFGHNS